MKPLLFALTVAAIACSCTTKKPVLRLLYYDPNNNRVDEKGQLLPWTNWGAGVKIGTNWVELIRAEEK